MLYECSGNKKKKNLFERKLNFQNKVTSTKKKQTKFIKFLHPHRLPSQPSGVTNINLINIFIIFIVTAFKDKDFNPSKEIKTTFNKNHGKCWKKNNGEKTLINPGKLYYCDVVSVLFNTHTKVQ